MIVVGTDDDGLVAQHRVAAREEPDHVLRPQAADVGVLRHGRFLRHGEGLEPASRGRLKSDLLEPPGEVGGGRVGPGGAGHPAAEPVVAETTDVVDRR